MVVIADPDTVFANDLTNLLRDMGLTAFVAADMPTLTKLLAEKPSLLIIDSEFDNERGLDVCQSLKAQFAIHVPVMLISSQFQLAYDPHIGISSGADIFIQKPFSDATFIEALKPLMKRLKA